MQLGQVRYIRISIQTAMKHFCSYFMSVLLVLHSALWVDSEIQVVLKHCRNAFNKKYVDKVLSPRKPINRTTSLTSADVYLKPGVILDSPLYIHVEAYKKFATQYKPFMLDYKTELCEALEVKSHPLYKFFFHKTNETESNILNPCPIQGHIYMKPYYTSYEHMPPLLPTGIWRTVITVTKDLDEKVFAFINYYEITSKGIEEF